MLVVNVTWRGKTYVGTLLDCTRHDWAPPRFCDSPTSDLDSRAPKGRGKRGRAGAQGTDLTNFTETRSSVHSKLRNGNGKGRSGRSTTPSVAGPGSPTPRTETSKPKPKELRETAQTTLSTSVTITTTTTTATTTTPTAAASASPAVRKPKPPTPNSPPPSPVLLECPEPNCCKKYKHINGLKYHQSHAHGSADDDDTKDGTSLSETEESNAEAPSPAATPDKSPAEKTDLPGKETPTPAPQDPLALPEPSPEPPVAPPTSPPLTDSTKSVVKPGVLRFGPVPEDFAFASKSVIAPVAPQPLTQASAPQQLPIKLPQFKVKSPAALMPEEKLKDRSKQPGFKKKKKSPEGSPHATSEPSFTNESGNREDLQSPAYSDISDDAAPVLESEVCDKAKGCHKKGEPGDASSQHGMSPYVGLFNTPFYNQPPYLVPSVPTDCKSSKEQLDKSELKSNDKEIKKEPGRPEFQQKLLQHPSHFYSYGYVPGYPSGFVDPGYPVMMDDKTKEVKEDKSPGPVEAVKHGASPIQVPNPSKVKAEQGKHSNENHQIIKESIEMKSQMGQFMYARQPGNPVPDDLRRFLCQSRKESDTKPVNKTNPQNPSPKPKEKSDEKKDKEVKHEGQKPTMETQGPPPPPTGQFAFIHPSYMQSSHYTALPFDPSHSMYRGMNPMIVPGPYGGAPYLGMSRFHAPEDLSRSQGTTKALDLLQHHANQYYNTTHKIHELQERALKSPTPGKATPSRESPSAPPRPPSGTPPAPPTSSASPMATDGKNSKLPNPENLDSRSPPTQRHVHTHHHTHVGLTYPLLPGQYTAPYGGMLY